VLPITEDEIIAAMRLLWERLKIIVEPSGAVPLAAVLKRPEIFCNQKTGLILSGGNTDLDSLPWSR
jgi:threonine dehydratase